jgi:galactokinase
VPFGAGLSSSASLESAVAVALDELLGLGLATTDAGRTRLVDACVRTENEVAGAPTGRLDQSASLRSHEGSAVLLDFRPGLSAQESAEIVPCDLAAAGLGLLVIDTRAPHQHTDGQYAERRATCEAAARLLGVETLRDVAAADLGAALDRLPDDVSRRRVRHVVTEDARVERFVELLRAGLHENADELGLLLDASHASLRDDYEVSCAELDVAVDAAVGAGAHGARMTGGGFGGSAVALVAAGQEQVVAAAVAGAFAERGFTAPGFLAAVPSAPAATDVAPVARAAAHRGTGASGYRSF